MAENINGNIDESVDVGLEAETMTAEKNINGNGEKNCGGEVKRLQEEIDAQKNNYDTLYDKYLRVSAEYENFRKRTAKEKVNIYFEATLDVLKTLLPISDNIERAVQFAETDKAEKVVEGLKMIYSQFADAFEKLGVKEIQAQGEKFNPEIHNAVFHEEDDTMPENTIVDVLQKGYMKGEKVIRPAMVKVVN